MKTVWILLVFSGVTFGHGVSTTTQVLQNQKACNEAAKWYNDADYWLAGAKAICVEDKAP